MNAAHKKFMRAFNLKPMKQVAVVFNPFDPTTTYMRHFLTHLRSRPIQQQNPSCKITHELLNDKSEPHIKFFIDKTEETYTMSPRRGPMHDQWVEFMLYVNYLMTVKKVIPQYIPYSHPRKMKLAHPNDACEKDAEPEERSLYEDDGDPESTDNDGICESKTTQMFKSMTIEQIQEWSHRKMLDGTFNWGLMSVPRMPRRAMNRHPYDPGFQWHFKNTKKYPVVEYGTSEETSTTAAAAATTGAAGAKKGGGATDKKAAAPAAAKKK